MMYRPSMVLHQAVELSSAGVAAHHAGHLREDPPELHDRRFDVPELFCPGRLLRRKELLLLLKVPPCPHLNASRVQTSSGGRSQHGCDDYNNGDDGGGSGAAVEVKVVAVVVVVLVMTHDDDEIILHLLPRQVCYLGPCSGAAEELMGARGCRSPPQHRHLPPQSCRRDQGRGGREGGGGGEAQWWRRCVKVRVAGRQGCVEPALYE